MIIGTLPNLHPSISDIYIYYLPRIFTAFSGRLDIVPIFFISRQAPSKNTVTGIHTLGINMTKYALKNVRFEIKILRPKIRES